VLEILWRNDAMRESTERQVAQYGGTLLALRGEMYVVYGDEWREWKREMRAATDDVLE
jgi:hypothetical protein